MNEELKPCSHCGSKGAEVVFDTVVLCSGCTAEAQPSDWNRRVVTPEQVEAAASADSAWWDYNDARLSREALVRHLLRAAGFEMQS